MPKPNPVVWVHKPNYAVVVPRPKNKPQLFGNINNSPQVLTCRCILVRKLYSEGFNQVLHTNTIEGHVVRR